MELIYNHLKLYTQFRPFKATLSHSQNNLISYPTSSLGRILKPGNELLKNTMVTNLSLVYLREVDGNLIKGFKKSFEYFKSKESLIDSLDFMRD